MAYPNNNQGGGNNQQSTLESIYSYSFAANHLLQVSLVKQPSDGKDYKKQYFFFLTLAPGVKTQDGGRSFDFQNKITLKVEIDGIKSLMHATRNTVNGREAMIGPFSIYVDSSKSAYGQQGAGGKSLFCQRGVDKKPTELCPNGSPTFVLFFKVGQNPALGYGFTPPKALAFADILEFLSDEALKMDFGKINISAANAVTPNPRNNGGNNAPFGQGPSNQVPQPQFNGGPSNQAPQPQFNNNQQTPSFNQQPQSNGFPQFNPDDDIPF